MHPAQEILGVPTHICVEFLIVAFSIVRGCRRFVCFLAARS
jgi:hypothetical protein